MSSSVADAFGKLGAVEDPAVRRLTAGLLGSLHSTRGPHLWRVAVARNLTPAAPSLVQGVCMPS